MKETKKTYWKGLEQLSNDPEYVKYADKEFAQELPVNGEDSSSGSSRRDFLKMMGFSVAAASLAACEAPVRKAIPYLNKPVDVDPGVPNYYASTYMEGGNYASILVKTREGRPIKIEGNELSPISKGGTSAQIEASLLSLYDEARYRQPMKQGEKSDWESVDKDIKTLLGSSTKVRVVGNTNLSPTRAAAVAEFKTAYPSAEWVTYDTQSASGILIANQQSFGKKVLPSYDFSKADVIVSFDADFLGTWISPVEFTKQYSTTRKLGPDKKKMSRHYQIESNMSVTGANADYRIPIKPSQSGAAVIALYNAVASKAGAAKVSGSAEIPHIEKAANDLWSSRGKSLVVSGSNDPNVQVLINGINDLLNNYGSTIDLTNYSNYRKGVDSEMDRLIADLSNGSVDAVIFYDCNPVYDHPKGSEIAAALAKTKLSVAISSCPNETSANCKYVAAANHYLESWGDAEPKPGHLSLAQPAINKLFSTRQGEESLLAWAGNNTAYYEYLTARWEKDYFSSQTKFGLFQQFFDTAVHDGLYKVTSKTVISEVSAEGEEDQSESTSTSATGGFSGNITASASAISSAYKGSGMELSLYYKVGVGDGRQANNPWLQEMPDPVTKATWDNYLTMSQADAKELGITMFEGKANMVQLSYNSITAEIPVLIQPGQAKGSLGLALGYGRNLAGKVGDNVGINANPMLTTLGGCKANIIFNGVSIKKTEKVYRVAQTQTHETYMGRDFVIQESILDEYVKNPSAGRHSASISTWKAEDGGVAPGMLSLWKGHEYPDHHWGLAIDLNSCTGCSACTIACQVENNIPVVGRDEVLNRREMHWIRIDRYYSSDADPDDFVALEKASENPEVTFQPMMCQHCNNAPCETVCPVAATTHSTEGLNQMTYNRCIGTRYCANNCPYKVRRFNWFKYHDNEQFAGSNSAMNSDLGKMVLNPDVTVRSRGVMEKCTFCVQRIQYGKLEAKKDRRQMNDGDVNTACASSCPADALVFGDLNNPESRISKLLKIETSTNKIDKEIGEERAFTVLEEVGVKPNVLYMTKIRNKDKEA